MAVLTIGSKATAAKLLAWDRGRIDSIEKRRISFIGAGGVRRTTPPDVSAYKARLDLSTLCINVDPASWPGEVRDLFMAVLEVLMAPSPVLQVGIGPLRASVPFPGKEDRAAYRQIAREIGVLERLREVAAGPWAEES